MIKMISKRAASEIRLQQRNKKLKSLTKQWLKESTTNNYSYHFEWLGLPVIQYPQDIIGTQQLIWRTQPDLIIETGIARGGSLILYASILELLAQCGGSKKACVLGIDIDIRAHNKKAILEHPMSKRIEMLEGSSVSKNIVDKVKAKARSAKKTMIFLDSNHTHQHVLEELKNYAPLVSRGSYLVVFDTVIEELPNSLFKDRPWRKGNSPQTAIVEYLQHLEHGKTFASDGKQLQFEVDEEMEGRLMITVAPGGYLRRL